MSEQIFVSWWRLLSAAFADRLSLWRCQITRHHTPMLAWRDGSLFLRCPSCGLRTDGVRVPMQQTVRRVRIDVF